MSSSNSTLTLADVQEIIVRHWGFRTLRPLQDGRYRPSSTAGIRSSCCRPAEANRCAIRLRLFYGEALRSSSRRLSR